MFALAARGKRLAGLSALCCFVLTATLVACETPVYRYAMYRWQPTPYEVYLMREQPPSDQQAEVLERLEQLSRDRKNAANVLAFDVDLAQAEALDRVPADVKRYWQSLDNPQLPTFVITSPLGIHVHTGPLDKQAVEQLVDSPARQQIAKELAAGKAGVLLLLDGSDSQANDEVHQLLRQIERDIARGEIELYAAPSQFGPTPSLPGGPQAGQAPAAEPAEQVPAEGTEQQGEQEGGKQGEGESGASEVPQEGPAAEPAGARETPHVEIGVLRVDRNDPREQWLVRTLLAVEDDLKEFSEPMVFAVYGRARALPPYIGKGITRRNLVECIEFITGACSCTVKEQNPGVDLLVRQDWDAAAAAVAAKFGAEEGNESQLGGFLPELIVPSRDEGAPAAPTGNGTAFAGSSSARPTAEGPSSGEAAGAAEGPVSDQDLANEHGSQSTATDPAATATKGAGTPSKGPAEPPAASDAQVDTETEMNDTGSDEPTSSPSASPPKSDEEPAVASADTASAPSDTRTQEPSVGTDWGMTVIGGGLILALIMLFAATFLVLRPR